MEKFQTGLKKGLITRNVSARAETEIGSKPKQEFVGDIGYFANLHLTCVNHLFSPD